MVVSQSAIEMAPPFSVVSRYFIFACFALLSTFLMLTMGDASLPILDFSVAAALHVYLLSFVMSVILGALYQLIPVVLESPFYSLKGSSWLFALFVLGGLLLSIGMFSGITPLMHSGGSAIYIALVWFGLLFLASFIKVKRWSIVTFFLLFASLWLMVGISLGFFTIFAMTGSVSVDVIALIVRHASVSLIGFVFFIVMGVSLVLLPMFSLSHGVSTIYSKISFIILNLSLVSALFGEFELMVFGLGLGIALY
ncbi:MAG: peptidase M50, partial [Campylobacteraceae bacterium]|nr:peptidase M50 [Campylobacteraceae bacterium]